MSAPQKNSASQAFDVQAELHDAVCAHQQKRLEEAEQKYRRVLAASPPSHLYTTALNNLGVLLEDTHRPADAEACYRQALAVAPTNVDAHCNLALLLHADGRVDEAETHYRQTVILKPDHVMAWNKLGLLLLKKEKLPEAEACFRAALKAGPDNAEAHANLGVTLYSKTSDERLPEVEAHYREALRLKPDYVEVQNNLGVLLQKTQKLDEAEKLLRAALAIKPDYRDARENLSNVLHAMQRYDEALVCCRDLLREKPDDLEMLSALGCLLRDLGQFDEAERVLRQVLQRAPERISVLFNLSLVLLAQGKWKEGWKLYEHRYGESEDWGAESIWHKRPVLPFPEWQGEALEGKSLVAWPEQGLGDVVQFARYLPLLKARGVSRLTMVCPAPLVSLIGTIGGVDACVPFDEAGQLPPHDYACFLLSLPWLFGTTLETIPANVPYINVPEDRVAHWKEKLPLDDMAEKSSKKIKTAQKAKTARKIPEEVPKALRVGLVWAGDPRPDFPFANAIDRRRSLGAKAFLPLLKTPGVTFVSLQKGESTRAQIEDLPQNLRPFDPMDDVQDFADTAAIIENLDLVITVDTSVAHVAGALNKPVWILSRFDACWRWLAQREDSPWYPSARIFRQQKPGDWTGTVEKVHAELQKALRKHRS